MIAHWKLGILKILAAALVSLRRKCTIVAACELCSPTRMSMRADRRNQALPPKHHRLRKLIEPGRTWTTRRDQAMTCCMTQTARALSTPSTGLEIRPLVKKPHHLLMSESGYWSASLGTNWPQMSDLPVLDPPIVAGMPDGPWSLEFAANHRLYGNSVFHRSYATEARYQAKTIPGSTFQHSNGASFTTPATTYYERIH